MKQSHFSFSSYFARIVQVGARIVSHVAKRRRQSIDAIFSVAIGNERADDAESKSIIYLSQ